MCRVLSRHFWSLISGYCLQHQLWVWNRIYLMETASVFQFTWKFFALVEIREPRSGQKLVQPLWNNFYSERSFIRAPYICVSAVQEVLFSTGMERLCEGSVSSDVFSTHALLLPFFPPSYIHCPPFWLWPSSQWLVTVQVGPYQVGVSRTSPHCCFRDQKRPAMVPKENPCFFCCTSSESLCSSSCMCKIFMLYY